VGFFFSSPIGEVAVGLEYDNGLPYLILMGEEKIKHPCNIDI
jgi:hypothetical protein